MKSSIYADRRARLARNIGEDCHIYIEGAKEVLRNGDVHFPFRQDSDFLYLTGFDEPNASLVITGGEESCSILFCAPKDPLAELWHGERIGPRRALRKYGVDIARPNTQEEIERELVAQEKVTQAFQGDLLSLIAEMRVIKDTHEISLMKKACNISAKAHRYILDLVGGGQYEYEVEAVLSEEFRRHGGHPQHAYPMIVASGKGACTLHYTRNNRRMHDGELLLIDAGCEYGGYASDITRTIPVSGKFSWVQRTIYDLVLSAQMEAIDMVRPGTPLHRVHNKACEVITEGLLRLGLITVSSLDVALMKQQWRPFFPHGTSHFLGMDVHDAGDYQRDPVTNLPLRKLEAGMVITVEPGIYIRPSREIPKEFWNIGIRIEDDVLVTDSKPHVLTSLAPKDPDEIERRMHW